MLPHYQQNIPLELRELNQWVYAGPDKVPMNPRTGKCADPTKPETGGTFQEALHCGMPHVGFILSENDPYCIIDLDAPLTEEQKERHGKIYRGFDTYAEKSQSGQGVHIVMRGKIPCAVRRDKFEVYSKERYMIFTGNVMRPLAINDCQDSLDSLFLQIGRLIDDTGDLIEEEQTLDDSHIWRMASNANNGENFRALCNATADSMPGSKDGTWAEIGKYESQSEADYALLSMLAFYSRSNEQIRRMFRETRLAQRNKSIRNDVYLNRSLKRIRNRETPLVDFSKLLRVATPIVPEPPAIPLGDYPPLPPPPFHANERHVSFPPGLVGEIASFILTTAIRPVPEIALAGAISFMAGIAGRTYNISSNGLNHYILVLAKTGRGKDGAASGIDLLINAVSQDVPMFSMFVGPGSFASGPAVVKTLAAQSCFLSVLGEFGQTLKLLCDSRANEAQTTYKRALLDAFSKSGSHKRMYSSAYSDKEKNTGIVQSPNLTLLGESNPTTFFASIDESHIAEGLISRFSIFQYDGLRPAKNPNAFHPPEKELVEKIKEVVTLAINSNHHFSTIPVSMTAEAKILMDEFDVFADSEINRHGSEVSAELWNRGDLKVLKLAALVAVGCSPKNPIITLDLAKWAINLTRREIGAILKRFTDGEIGTGEQKQDSEIKRLFAEFQKLTPEQKITYRCPPALLEMQVIPFHYLNLRCRTLSCFKDDRRGSKKALDEALNTMTKTEVLEMIPLSQLLHEHKTRSPVYYPGAAWS